MKRLILASALALTSTAAMADGPSTVVVPVVTPMVVEQDAASSNSHDWIPPVMFLLLVAMTWQGGRTPG